MGPKLGEELRWVDLLISTPVEPGGLKAAAPSGGEDASHSFLWKYLPRLPIAFVKWQPPCLARALHGQ